MRRPLESVGACEAEVGAERVAHRVDEPVGAARREPVLPPEVDDLHPGLGPVDARLDPADEAIAEEDRQHVPTPAPLGRREEELPDVVEPEQRPEQAPVPHERIERRQECDGRRRLRGRSSCATSSREHEALPAHALDLDRNELAPFDQLLAQCLPTRVLRKAWIGLGRPDAAEHVVPPLTPSGRGRGTATGACAELLRERDVAREESAGSSRSSRS